MERNITNGNCVQIDLTVEYTALDYNISPLIDTYQKHMLKYST